MAYPMSAAVPIGARRMIHHSTFWTTARADSVNLMKTSACSPTFSAAMPKAMDSTRICSTLMETLPLKPASTSP